MATPISTYVATLRQRPERDARSARQPPWRARRFASTGPIHTAEQGVIAAYGAGRIAQWPSVSQ